MSAHTLVGKPIGPIGFGLMGFTWRPQVTSDEQAFAAMKEAINQGATFWNGGEFYGVAPNQTANLKLIARYFAKYPEDADKVVLSIKGGIDLSKMAIDGSADFVKSSVDNVISLLGGHKKLDIFECARVDPKVPIEETIGALAEYVKAGKISGIGVSETSAATLRKAHAVHPIAAVELEYSLWSTDALDTIKAAGELNIPVVAYSPLGRGFLTGQIRSVSDIPENDIRHHFDRFQPENFSKNLKLVDDLVEFSKKRNVTPAQLAVGWILAQSAKNGFPTIIPIPGATTAARVVENTTIASLNADELKELQDILDSISIVGGRYNSHMESTLLV